MHISGMRFGTVDRYDVPWGFVGEGEENSIFFDERVNVFIGPNASGKTSILRLLHGLLPPAGFGFGPPSLNLENWPTQDAPMPSVGYAIPERIPVSVPVTVIPATRVGIGVPGDTRVQTIGLPGASRVRVWGIGAPHIQLRGPESFLTSEGHETDGMTPNEMAKLLLSLGTGAVLYAEQVQHATEILIRLAEHKSQSDVHDVFDRKLVATSLTTGKDMDELCEQIKEVINQFRTALSSAGRGDFYPAERINAWRIWLANFPDSRVLAVELGVSNEQICVAINRLNEEDGNWMYDKLANQASYSVNIDDEDVFLYASNVTSKAFANFHKAIKLSQICSKQICDEVLADDRPSHISYELTDIIQGIVHERTRTIQDVVVRTAHPVFYVNEHGEPGHTDSQRVYELSAGTESTLWWIRLIALNMLYHADFKFGWEKQPAILLIDEIENHLHPTWQRRVIPALLEHFPRLQIFATTHSPFVIAGLKAGQVHLLNRDANGVVTASSNTEDIIGWTADEILRVFMGVEDPTDDATAAAARELRQLRDAGPHPDEREEEQRQARMRELQQQVDRNLLAGGPRAAEDERFAENLTRILEKYRLTKDLNQENG